MKGRSIIVLFVSNLFLFPGFLFGQAPAQKEVDSLRQVLETTSDDSVKVRANQRLASLLIFQDRPEAIRLGRKALDLASRMQWDKARAAAFNLLGTAAIYDSRYDSAVFYFQQRQLAGRQMQDTAIIAGSLANTGIAYYYKGDYRQSLEQQFDALQGFEQIGNKAGQQRSLNNIGICYERLGENELALSYYQRALPLAREMNDGYIQATLQGNIGIIYKNQGDFRKALHFHLQSLESARTIGQQALLIDQLNNIAGDYQGMNRLDSAAYYTRLGLEAAQQQGDQNAIMAFSLKQGELFNLQKRFSAAIPHLLTAEEIARQNKDREHILEIYQNLATAYESTGQDREALQIFKRYAAQKDSLLDAEKAKQINELEIKYATAKKEETLQRQQLEIQRAKARGRLWTISTILTILLALSIGLGLWFRMKTQDTLSRQKVQIRDARIQQLEQTQRLINAKAVYEIQEQERRRIAKDLHDEMGGLIASIKGHLQSLIGRPPANKEPLFQKTNALIDQAGTEIRRIAHNMMPSTLAKFGLQAAVRDIANELQQLHGITTELELIQWDQRLPESTEVMLYRIVKELTHNIVKSAQAKQVLIQLALYEDNLTLVIEDDGIGFDINKARDQGGIGLKSVESRVEYLNGELDIFSEAGAGTTFSITVPVDKV